VCVCVCVLCCLVFFFLFFFILNFFFIIEETVTEYTEYKNIETNTTTRFRLFIIIIFIVLFFFFILSVSLNGVIVPCKHSKEKKILVDTLFLLVCFLKQFEEKKRNHLFFISFFYSFFLVFNFFPLCL